MRRPSDGLAHVFCVALGVGPRFGREEHPLLCTHNDVPVRAHIDAFASRVLAPGIVFDASDVVALGVGFDQALVNGEGGAPEQFVQDVDDSLVLEDPAVGSTRRKVQSGTKVSLYSRWRPFFFAEEGGVGDDGVDLAGARADAGSARTDRALDELAGAVQLDRAADLAANEVVEVEVSRLAGAEVQAIRGLELEVVFEQAVGPLSPRKTRKPKWYWRPSAPSSKRTQEHAR